MIRRFTYLKLLYIPKQFLKFTKSTNYKYQNLKCMHLSQNYLNNKM